LCWYRQTSESPAILIHTKDSRKTDHTPLRKTHSLFHTIHTSIKILSTVDDSENGLTKKFDYSGNNNSQQQLSLQILQK